jgi:hypothetical protein
MTKDGKMIFPLNEGLYTLPSLPDEKTQLIGSKCTNCGELFFPKKDKGLCIHCQQITLEEVKLSRQGKIASFTIVLQPPSGGFYHGPVPYAYGYVDLPEGVRIETRFTGDFNALEIGGDVELVIEKLYEDAEGNEFVTYKFKPLKD